MDLEMDTYFNSKVDTKYFYNEKLKNKVFNYYKTDFTLFFENGIDYISKPL